MSPWLSKVFEAISNLSDAKEAVRQVFRHAQSDRAKISVELSTKSQPSMMITTIEQVRDDDIVISQPVIGGHTYPLAFGESMRLSFVCDGMHHSGHSRCLGRIKIPSGGVGGAGAAGAAADEAVMFAYRLALPDSLETDDQRAQPRVLLAPLGAIEAQLYAPAVKSGPTLGTMADLSMSGARIVSSLPASWLMPGGAAFLKAMLPEPVGLLDELVDIARIEPEPQSGRFAIGIKFRRRIDGLAELIKAAQGIPPEQRRKSA